jgi:hypothetical protein
MLNVYNRMLLLHDCDAFTKQFYIEQRGRSPEEFRPVLMECTRLPAASPSLRPGDVTSRCSMVTPPPLRSSADCLTR